MSIGQQRKREEQWRYQLNEQTQRFADDLLARIPPDRERIVDVRSVGEGVPENAKLWARLSEDRGQVEFLRGETVCGTQSTEILSQLGAPVEATLFEAVKDQGGVLTLKVAPADRHALRSPKGDDDVH